MADKNQTQDTDSMGLILSFTPSVATTASAGVVCRGLSWPDYVISVSKWDFFGAS